VQDRLTQSIPAAPGLTNQPSSTIWRQRPMLTLCTLPLRASMQLCSLQWRPRLGVLLTVESAGSPEPPPHDESMLQFVTSPVTSCNLQPDRPVVGTQETHAAGLHPPHSPIRHENQKIILSPFALCLLPRLPHCTLRTAHALRSEIWPRAASVRLHGADTGNPSRLASPTRPATIQRLASCRSCSIVSRSTEAMLAICSARL
jgi:hypothetical protein